MDGWANRYFPLWQQWPLSSSIEVKCENSPSALLPTHQDVIRIHVDCNFLNVTDELVHHSNPKWKPHLEKDSLMSAHGMSLLTLCSIIWLYASAKESISPNEPAHQIETTFFENFPKYAHCFFWYIHVLWWLLLFPLWQKLPLQFEKCLSPIFHNSI